MTPDTIKRNVSFNAAIWGAAMLASVILPFVTDSLTEGRSAFLRIAAHVAPLIVGMYVSSLYLARACQKPAS